MADPRDAAHSPAGTDVDAVPPPDPAPDAFARWVRTAALVVAVLGAGVAVYGAVVGVVTWQEVRGPADPDVDQGLAGLGYVVAVLFGTLGVLSGAVALVARSIVSHHRVGALVCLGAGAAGAGFPLWLLSGALLAP